MRSLVDSRLEIDWFPDKERDNSGEAWGPLEGEVLVGLTLFFFFYTVLVSGFGVADTHVLFRLTPPEAPARTLVLASVVVGACSSLAPMLIGLGLERALASASQPLLVYHAFFAVAAGLQALAFLPLRGLDRAAVELG